MQEYLLDADHIIEWLRPRSRVTEPLAELVASGGILATNACTYAEVYSGLALEEREAADIFFASVDYWVIEIDAARLAGFFRYRHAREGRKLAVPDTLLAAQAVIRGAIVLTANERDFPMPEVRTTRLY